MDIVAAKRTAGYRAVDENFQDGFRNVGVGSGSTVIYVVERFRQILREAPERLKGVSFVPTGFQSKMLILDAGLELKEIDRFDKKDIDIVFDGADEIDAQLNCIKGGGACLFQEKLVGHCSRRFVGVADETKISSKLGEKWTQGVPIEVVPPALRKVQADLLKLGARSATVRFGGRAKAGPIVTDNGNFIIDTDFGPIEPDAVVALDNKIRTLVGVVETGLFEYMDIAYVGFSDGTCQVISRPSLNEVG